MAGSRQWGESAGPPLGQCRPCPACRPAQPGCSRGGAGWERGVCDYVYVWVVGGGREGGCWCGRQWGESAGPPLGQCRPCPACRPAPPGCSRGGAGWERGVCDCVGGAGVASSRQAVGGISWPCQEALPALPRLQTCPARVQQGWGRGGAGREACVTVWGWCWCGRQQAVGGNQLALPSGLALPADMPHQGAAGPTPLGQLQLSPAS